jgi:hypothetical protein
MAPAEMLALLARSDGSDGMLVHHSFRVWQPPSWIWQPPSWIWQLLALGSADFAMAPCSCWLGSADSAMALLALAAGCE